MTRLWSQSAACEITPKHDRRGQRGAFTWHGRTYRIERVLQHWRVDCDWWSESGSVSREYWTVITKDHLLCVLYCDLCEQRWYLSKVYD